LPQHHIKDPQARRTYAIDYLTDGWLEGGETIVTSTWTVPTALTGDQQINTGTRTSIRLAGGVAGVDYTVTNTVTLSSGEIDERSIFIRVRER
jgi:hypothetical protein